MGLELIKSKYKYLVANNIPCLNIPWLKNVGYILTIIWVHFDLKILGTF